jgi:nucleoporin GLE1
MPARNPNDESLASRLLRSHISTTSSAEDLTDTEAAHKSALEAAQREHQRVRDSAVRAYTNNVLKEEQERLRRAQKQELERLKLEAERAKLAAEVLELQRKQIPLPTPPKPTPPPAVAPAPKQLDHSQNQPTNGQNHTESLQNVRARPPPQQKSPPRQLERPQTLPQPPERAIPQSQSLQPQSIPPKLPNTPSAPLAANRTPMAPGLAKTIPAHDSTSSHALPGAEKYLEIHKRLKQLRAFVTEHAKQDPDLKKKMGEMRRVIRKSVGQLTEGRGANKTPVGGSQSIKY